jgi:MFS family permease
MTIAIASAGATAADPAATEPTIALPDLPVTWRSMWQDGHLGRFAILCLGVWLHATDCLLVATLIPSTVADIGGAQFINWTIALYQLASITAGAAAGLMVARIGYRPAMIGAALIYAVGCCLSAVAPNMLLMLIGRLLQGCGGGSLVALAFVAMEHLFPTRIAVRLLAIISTVWGVAAFTGPLIGGFFAALGEWRLGFWAFAAQAVLLAVIILVRQKHVAIALHHKPRMPVLRLVVFALAVLAIASAGIDVTWLRASLFCLTGAGLLAVFLWLDHRGLDRGGGNNRLFPRQVAMPRHPLGAGFAVIFVSATATIAFTVYSPVLLTSLAGANPLLCGYMIAIESISWTVATLIISSLHRVNQRWLIRCGSAGLTIAVAGLALTMPLQDGSWTSLALLLPFIILEGAGFGMCYPFIQRRIVAAADEPERGRASAGVPTVQMIGYAIGAAASGIIANAAGFAEGVSRDAALHVGFWVFAAFLPLCLIGNLCAWRLTRTDKA